VIIERGPTSWGAYAPDLPGCVAVADDVEEVKALMREAIQLHLEDMREQGLVIPPPSQVVMLEAI
jgi:predicted RNase H-like HicB family nuclease